FHLRKTRAQAVGQFSEACPDRVHSELVGLVDRLLEAQDAGEIALPVLEAQRLLEGLVFVVASPFRGVVVEEDRLDAGRRLLPRVEEAGAAGPAQVFAAGGRQEIA